MCKKSTTTCCAFVLAVACVFARGAPFANGDPAAPGEAIRTTMPALSWTEVPIDDIGRSLEFLSAQTKSNFERIKTWESTWDVHVEEYISPENVVAHYSGKLSAPSTQGLIRAYDVTMKRAIDVASRKIFRDNDTRELRHLSADTRDPVVVKQASVVDERSVVTPSEFLYFNSKYPPARYSVLPDHPDAHNKRAAHRVPAEQTANRDGSDLMDPQLFYRCSSAQMCWDQATMLADALRGGLGAEQQKLARDGLRVDKAVHEGQDWFRIRLTTPAAGAQPLRQFTSIWSPRAGYYPVSATVSRGAEPGGDIESEKTWEWKQVDDIYVPAYHSEIVRSPELNGLETYERVARMKDCTLNEPLDPDIFTVVGLGLPPGDLVIDEIEQAVFMHMGDGKLKELAPFHGSSPRVLSRDYVWWIIGLIPLLAAVILIIRRKRGRGFARA
jgi:hypothetical protein